MINKDNYSNIMLINEENFKSIDVPNMLQSPKKFLIWKFKEF